MIKDSYCFYFLFTMFCHRKIKQKNSRLFSRELQMQKIPNVNLIKMNLCFLPFGCQKGMFCCCLLLLAMGLFYRV